MMILFFICIPILCASQVVTSLQTIVFPNTDSVVSLQDTVTVSVNQESGMIEFIHSDGTTTYPVDSIKMFPGCVRYYLQGKILFVEFHNDFILVLFANAPQQPIELLKLSRQWEK